METSLGKSLRRDVRFSALVAQFLAIVLCACIWHLPALAQSEAASVDRGASISDSTEDINSLLNKQERKKALIHFDPLDPAHNAWEVFTKSLYNKIGLDLGVDVTGLYQHASTVLPGSGDHGFVVDYDFYGRWDLGNL
jgi:hypothetical protein